MAIRILYVEDEQSTQDLVSMHLVLQGFEVMTAANGEDAIRILESEPFDLLLLDIQMPKMNGIEVLRCIKIRHIDVRPIMLTGADDLRALDECAKWGAFDYLPKPYNFHELMDSIDRALTRASCFSEAA
jgi:two-component system, NtrC family, response regulator AtoC